MHIKKIMIAAAAVLSVVSTGAIADMGAPDITGFWKTIDDKTGNAKSIVRLYNCDEDELCGRIVAIYNVNGTAIEETLANPKKIAEEVKGKPTMVGLDIIWDMEWDNDDNRFEDGDILDPKSGSVYSSVIWQEEEDVAKGELRVRGKIGPFGRTQTWLFVPAANTPAELHGLDVSAWRPVVAK